MQQMYKCGKTYVPLSLSNRHAHDKWEIILNLSGEGEYIFPDQTLPFGPRSIVCIPPNTPHEKRSNGLFEDIFFRWIGEEDFFGNAVLNMQDDEFKSIEKIMEIIHYSYYRDEERFSGATTELCRSVLRMIQERMDRPVGNPYAERIRRRIIQRFSDPEFLVSKAMEGIPYCADYLRRLFHKEFGSTPQKYLLQLRMDNACRLLERQNAPSVTETALLSGFYDVRYFSRIFRQMVGCSPSEYARQDRIVFKK